MQPGVMPAGHLSGEDVRAVLLAATAAPSLHNSQPWQFRCSSAALELHADPRRATPAADPDHRELLLACGAALFNLRMAIRARGVHPAVALLPDPDRPDLLAVVRPHTRRPVTALDRALCDAIPRRRTNRGPFLPRPFPASLLNGLRQAAKLERAWLATLTPAQLPVLRTLVRHAHEVQQRDPAFVAEWGHWTGRDANSTDGVPARSSGPLPEPHDQWVLRDFSAGQAPARRQGKDFEPQPLIVIIGSFHDLPLAHLQAGQGMQRVLLTVTSAGLAASFLSQVVEVPETRRRLRELIGGGLWPQAVLRLGYGSPVPATSRRPLEDVVEAVDEASTAAPSP